MLVLYLILFSGHFGMYILSGGSTEAQACWPETKMRLESMLQASR